jgi:hypothetical protein
VPSREEILQHSFQGEQLKVEITLSFSSDEVMD